ncbi:MAG: tetratricopeptide repeat protein [Acidobacteria bacterium]|nr:tetratricopeptide repeat protein [Acidobacteriota bacterium]
MRAETRHQLKQDKFSKATINAAEQTVHWSIEHQKSLVIAAIVVVLALLAGLGGWYYMNQQEQKASLELGKAIRTLETPVRPEGVPPQPDYPSFGSSKERATQAHKEFQAVVSKYGHTTAGDVARYLLGQTAADLGDYAEAERELKEVASSSKKDTAALANFALASVYRQQGKNKDAISLYKGLIDKPAATVSKPTAQLALAETYLSDQQPLDAKKIYEQVQKDNPTSPAARLASAQLQDMK